MKRALGMMALTLAAACSGGGSSSAPTTAPAPTTSPASSTSATLPPSVTVRVVISSTGPSGCSGDNPISGNGSRVVAKDGAGTVIGTGTFALTPGKDICDWQARVPLSTTPDFLTLDGDVRELATVSRADYADGGVVITITAGTVRVT